ncbi:hypothetical protein GCM10007147_01220 [Nocardiopsis kunsanensis]|uniref:Uncharacterized protein n=1 Tax=Nocardiopsis kunsanensis TaxID=141693 RepID=A0A918X629_9ACTN|nr:hypothetical protein GCM10007147_01220 [Nocardiopsis kunsanensis]
MHSGTAGPGCSSGPDESLSRHYKQPFPEPLPGVDVQYVSANIIAHVTRIFLFRPRR